MIHVPKIKYNPEIPEALIAEGTYRVKFLSAEFRFGRIRGTPYVRMKAQIETTGTFVGRTLFVSYSYRIPGLPSNKAECDNFVPVDGRVKVRHREYEDMVYNDTLILGVGHD